MSRKAVRAWAMLAAAIVLVMVGCDEVIPQQVIVNVAGWRGAPKLLRLHEATECTGPYREATRSAEMGFKFDTASTRGGIGVVTQDVALCYSTDADWRLLWSSRHGGGAKRIVVKCDGATSCTDEFFYR